MDELTPNTGVLFSLPRPREPLPPNKNKNGRFETLGAMIIDAWKKDTNPPRFAWVRYSLSVGTPVDVFVEKFKRLSEISHSFGQRVLVRPVRMDHHEIEVADFNHMANPHTGQYEIELVWRKKRCDGGTHIFFAVETDKESKNRDFSKSLITLDALESMVRTTLGAMLVMQTRRTFHIDLESNAMLEEDSGTVGHVYGAEELPRVDAASVSAAVDAFMQSSALSPQITGRLLLGMRWADLAFKTHDLLAFWTSIEVLAGCSGQAVFRVFAAAYGLRAGKEQEFAQSLGIRTIYRFRGDLVHNGTFVNISPEGASYLSALIHDLVRHI